MLCRNHFFRESEVFVPVNVFFFARIIKIFRFWLGKENRIFIINQILQLKSKMWSNDRRYDKCLSAIFLNILEQLSGIRNESNFRIDELNIEAGCSDLILYPHDQLKNTICLFETRFYANFSPQISHMTPNDPLIVSSFRFYSFEIYREDDIQSMPPYHYCIDLIQKFLVVTRAEAQMMVESEFLNGIFPFNLLKDSILVSYVMRSNLWNIDWEILMIRSLSTYFKVIRNSKCDDCMTQSNLEELDELLMSFIKLRLKSNHRTLERFGNRHSHLTELFEELILLLEFSLESNFPVSFGRKLYHVVSKWLLNVSIAFSRASEHFPSIFERVAKRLQDLFFGYSESFSKYHLPSIFSIKLSVIFLKDLASVVSESEKVAKQILSMPLDECKGLLDYLYIVLNTFEIDPYVYSHFKNSHSTIKTISQVFQSLCSFTSNGIDESKLRYSEHFLEFLSLQKTIPILIKQISAQDFELAFSHVLSVCEWKSSLHVITKKVFQNIPYEGSELNQIQLSFLFYVREKVSNFIDGKTSFSPSTFYLCDFISYILETVIAFNEKASLSLEYIRMFLSLASILNIPISVDSFKFHSNYKIYIDDIIFPKFINSHDALLSWMSNTYSSFVSDPDLMLSAMRLCGFSVNNSKIIDNPVFNILKLSAPVAWNLLSKDQEFLSSFGNLRPSKNHDIQHLTNLIIVVGLILNLESFQLSKLIIRVAKDLNFDLRSQENVAVILLIFRHIFGFPMSILRRIELLENFLDILEFINFNFIFGSKEFICLIFDLILRCKISDRFHTSLLRVLKLIGTCLRKQSSHIASREIFVSLFWALFFNIQFDGISNRKNIDTIKEFFLSLNRLNLFDSEMDLTLQFHISDERLFEKTLLEHRILNRWTLFMFKEENVISNYLDIILRYLNHDDFNLRGQKGFELIENLKDLVTKCNLSTEHREKVNRVTTKMFLLLNFSEVSQYRTVNLFIEELMSSLIPSSLTRHIDDAFTCCFILKSFAEFLGGDLYNVLDKNNVSPLFVAAASRIIDNIMFDHDYLNSLSRVSIKKVFEVKANVEISNFCQNIVSFVYYGDPNAKTSFSFLLSYWVSSMHHSFHRYFSVIFLAFLIEHVDQCDVEFLAIGFNFWIRNMLELPTSNCKNAQSCWDLISLLHGFAYNQLSDSFSGWRKCMSKFPQAIEIVESFLGFVEFDIIAKLMHRFHFSSRSLWLVENNPKIMNLKAMRSTNIVTNFAKDFGTQIEGFDFAFTSLLNSYLTNFSFDDSYEQVMLEQDFLYSKKLTEYSDIQYHQLFDNKKAQLTPGFISMVQGILTKKFSKEENGVAELSTLVFDIHDSLEFCIGKFGQQGFDFSLISLNSVVLDIWNVIQLENDSLSLNRVFSRLVTMVSQSPLDVCSKQSLASASVVILSCIASFKVDLDFPKGIDSLLSLDIKPLNRTLLSVLQDISSHIPSNELEPIQLFHIPILSSHWSLGNSNYAFNRMEWLFNCLQRNCEVSESIESKKRNRDLLYYCGSLILQWQSAICSREPEFLQNIWDYISDFSTDPVKHSEGLLQFAKLNDLSFRSALEYFNSSERLSRLNLQSKIKSDLATIEKKLDRVGDLGSGTSPYFKRDANADTK